MLAPHFCAAPTKIPLAPRQRGEGARRAGEGSCWKGIVCVASNGDRRPLTCPFGHPLPVGEGEAWMLTLRFCVERRRKSPSPRVSGERVPAGRVRGLAGRGSCASRPTAIAAPSPALSGILSPWEAWMLAPHFCASADENPPRPASAGRGCPQSG